MEETNGMSRRKVLKLSVGTVGGGSAIIGNAAGSTDERTSTEIYNRALEILNETNNRDRFKNFLKNNGFRVESSSRKISFRDKTDTGGISTQQLYVRTMDAEITLSEYCRSPEYTFVDFSWGFDMGEMYQSGDKANDVIGIYYPYDSYNRIVGSQHGGEYVEAPGENDPSVGDLDTNGVAFEWNDKKHHNNVSDSSWPQLGSHCGLKLKKDNPSDPPEERIVIVDYKHSYRRYPVPTAAIESISISVGGLSVGFGANVQSWDANWEKSEKELEKHCVPRIGP
ncbi:hypothetical protein [Natrinema sp. H-ect4]|uniref:hypothetical protein n=1 Tax=Natrinema sp. H-ect4 TaxID=3242699 RepID=UPI0035A82917